MSRRAGTIEVADPFSGAGALRDAVSADDNNGGTRRQNRCAAIRIDQRAV